jgi:hypothetical protein
MKLFAIAFSITCVIAAVLFAIALAVLLPFVEHSEAMKAAAALGGVPILTFPKIAEFLEQERSRKNLVAGKRTPVYDFRGFQIAWPLMVLYGVLLLAAIDAISSVVGGFLAAGVMISQDRQEDAITAMYVGVVMATPPIIVGAYLVGRWIGTRCSRRGVIVVLLVVLAYTVLQFVLEQSYLLIASDDDDVARFTRETLVVRLVAGACLSVLVLLIGYWRGRKARLSKYLYYLLGVLPAETRDTVVELAFDEAQKVASAAGRARISTTQ